MASQGIVALVEDDELLRGSLAGALRKAGYEVKEASSVEGGKHLLESAIDILVTDVVLSDGSGVDLVRAAASLTPSPAIVAISGRATPPQAFELAELGAAKYLQKPVTVQRLLDAIAAAQQHNDPLELAARRRVGRDSLNQVHREVRRAMTDEAMARAKGSRSGAARLLGVSRRSVGRLLDEDEAS